MLGWIVMVIIVVAYFFPSDDKKQSPTVEKGVVNEKKINSAGRLKLTQQYNDPGYTESSFPSDTSFWLFLKSPPASFLTLIVVLPGLLSCTPIVIFFTFPS